MNSFEILDELHDCTFEQNEDIAYYNRKLYETLTEGSDERLIAYYSDRIHALKEVIRHARRLTRLFSSGMWRKGTICFHMYALKALILWLNTRLEHSTVLKIDGYIDTFTEYVKFYQFLYEEYNYEEDKALNNISNSVTQSETPEH